MSSKKQKPVSDTHDNIAKRNKFSQKLVCINYPGIVKDVDKMIQTLGGMSDIENHVGTKRKTMELKFRPKDKYCKPVMSELDKKPGILMKVKIKKQPENNVLDPSKKEEPEIEYEVVGITALTHSFNKLCDFQYLPLVSQQGNETKDTPLEYMYNKIIPPKLPEYSWLVSEESENMTLFLPPAVYSRFDNPQNCLYFDRSKFYEGRFKPEYANMLKQQELDRKAQRTIDQKLLARKSGHGAVFKSFHDPFTLTAPPRLAVQFLNIRYTHKGGYEKIKELFEDRPIWSRAALLCVSDVPKEQLKFILPAVSYHYHNGPWRVMWVRYGYDPKKDPESRIYQTFDFRARTSAGLKLKVRSKRSYVTNRFTRLGTEVRQVSLSDVCGKQNEPPLYDESAYILRPGIIPPARQMFYQYCDVLIPEIQSMLNRLPPVLPGTKCDFKNGWLPNKFTDQCREIAYKYVAEQVQKEILEDKKRCMEQETSGSENAKPGTSKSFDSGEQISQELLEISDSESDSESNASLSRDKDYSDEDENVETVEQVKSKQNTSNNEDVGDEIDVEAVEDLNRILGKSYAKQDFDKLVYDSDSD